MQHLGGAEAVQNVHADGLLPAAQDFGRQRLAGGDRKPERVFPRPRRLAAREQHGEQGRHAEEDRGPRLAQQAADRPRLRRPFEQHRSGARRHRECQAVAEPVGEEQLGGGKQHVVFAHAQRRPGIELSRARHVAVKMHRPLGLACRARGVEPEAHLVLHGIGRAEDRALGRDQPREFAAILDDAVVQSLEGRGEIRRDEGRLRAGVAQHEGVVVARQPRIDRHRDDAGLDGAEEAGVEIRRVIEAEKDALLAPDA